MRCQLRNAACACFILIVFAVVGIVAVLPTRALAQEPISIDLSKCEVRTTDFDRTYTGDDLGVQSVSVRVTGSVLNEYGISCYGYSAGSVPGDMEFTISPACYSYSLKNNRDAGTVSIVITATGKSSYSYGSGIVGTAASLSGSVEKNFKIYPVNISNADAFGLLDSVSVSQAKQRPVLSYKGKQLVEGQDYTLEYHNADRPGTAWLGIKGKGNFVGASWFRYTVSLDVKQYGGALRYDTAALINQAELDYGNYDGVIVASAEDGRYPDALCASGLSGVLNYPIVLVNGSGPELQTPSVQALQNIAQGSSNPLDIVIVGGTSAISSDIERELENYGNVSARLGGETRYDTALDVYEYGRGHGGWNTDYAFVARGDGFADSLSIAPFASLNKAPVLLVPSSASSLGQLSSVVGEFGSVGVLGGSSAVSNGVFSDLKRTCSGAFRLSGQTRYETSVAIAKWELQNGMNFSAPGFADGSNFPDSLASGFLQAKKGSVLLLIDGHAGAVGGDCATLISQNVSNIDSIAYFGGANAVSNSVRSAIENSIKGPYGWTDMQLGNSYSICSVCGYQHTDSVRHSHELYLAPACGFLSQDDVTMWTHLEESAFGLTDCDAGSFNNAGSESINTGHRMR